jgi:ankyrin repeat protein
MWDMPFQLGTPAGKLMTASYRGDIYKMKRMIKSGADVNEIDGFMNATTNTLEDCNALCIAARHGVLYSVDFLLGEGADPNVRISHGNTALMEAAARGHLRVVVALIESGADIWLENDHGKTASDLASEAGYILVSKTVCDPSHVSMAEISQYTRQHLPRQATNLRPIGFWGCCSRACLQ